MAKCQNKSIIEQYFTYDVRVFDLRIRFDKEGNPVVAHGLFVFDIDYKKLCEDLDFLNSKKCTVRILHEVRTKRQYTEDTVVRFRILCSDLQNKYPNITFYCGRNLYNWKTDYEFGKEPTEESFYSSVRKPYLIDDWWPWLYARFNNKKVLKKGTDAEILAIDFVNIR